MAHAQEAVVLPALTSDKSTSASDDSKREKLSHNEAVSAPAADPDFEDKIELKYDDCPEKTGFAYPS